MDRPNLSEEIIQELGILFTDSLRQAGPLLLESADFDTLERRVQVIGRQVLGRVVEACVQAIAAAVPADDPKCPNCHRRMRLVDSKRGRELQGLVGDYQVRRAYYYCDVCQSGLAPLDERLGLGSGVVSPALGRVICRLGIEASFEEAADAVGEVLQTTIYREAGRRVTESIGAVAEAEEQAMIAEAEKGVEPVGELAEGETPKALLVAVDGAKVHLEDGWREVKASAIGSLGPKTEVDRDSGRERLVLEGQTYTTGFEAAERFWWRVYVDACRHGLGSLALTMVVVLGDGADWIWRYARSFLGLPGIELVEIVDIYHAFEHLWSVANAVYGEGSVQAMVWVEPLKKALMEEGVGPILDALRALSPPEGAAKEVRKAIDYFSEHRERMRYPEFIERGLPIGSGAVESACKTVIGQREKGPGMRWTRGGAQAVATLRAIHRSGRWDSFWSTNPMKRRQASAFSRCRSKVDSTSRQAA
ncbi:MAG: ISKra4 family transposase [Candidatus Oleimicrobiaceae bacterium]